MNNIAMTVEQIEEACEQLTCWDAERLMERLEVNRLASPAFRHHLAEIERAEREAWEQRDRADELAQVADGLQLDIDNLKHELRIANERIDELEKLLRDNGIEEHA